MKTTGSVRVGKEKKKAFLSTYLKFIVLSKENWNSRQYRREGYCLIFFKTAFAFIKTHI